MSENEVPMAAKYLVAGYGAVVVGDAIHLYNLATTITTSLARGLIRRAIGPDGHIKADLSGINIDEIAEETIPESRSKLRRFFFETYKTSESHMARVEQAQSEIRKGVASSQYTIADLEAAIAQAKGDTGRFIQKPQQP